MKIFTRSLLIVFLCTTLPSCATLTGLITGPVTGAKSLGTQTYNLAKEQENEKAAGWAALYGLYGLVLGGPCAAWTGIQADRGYFKRGDYNGSREFPPFNEVFHPFHFNHIKE